MNFNTYSNKRSMTKILVIFISRDIKDSDNNLLTIKKNLIDSLKNDNTIVDLCSVLSQQEINNTSYKNILGNFKYEFINNEPQLRKLCSIFNTINYDDYDWYIKVRPEINLLETITHEKLETFSKEKVNTRCRGYYGPHINLPYGCSIQNIRTAPHNVKEYYNYKKYNDKYTIINPDDQMFFFHKNIAAKAFAPFSFEKYLEFSEKLKSQTKKPFWFYSLYEWSIIDNYFIKNKNREAEGYHGFIWYNRNILINPISINLSCRYVNSGKLIVI